MGLAILKEPICITFKALAQYMAFCLPLNGPLLICIFMSMFSEYQYQGSKIALVRSYLRVSQAAGQVEILIFLMKMIFFLYMPTIFCDAGQVLILRYFEA